MDQDVDLVSRQIEPVVQRFSVVFATEWWPTSNLGSGFGEVIRRLHEQDLDAFEGIEHSGMVPSLAVGCELPFDCVEPACVELMCAHRRPCPTVPAVNWVLRRQAARVILLDPDGRVFLINSADPGDSSKTPWWEIPGGGIDPGEPSADAVARELREEAGIEQVEVGPVVYTQYVEFSFGGYDFEQHEVLHVAHTEQTEIAEPQGLEYLEALAFRGARWWTVDEVQASTEPFLPPELPELLPRLVAGDFPDPPVHIRHDGTSGHPNEA